jgi:hypothetical protein
MDVARIWSNEKQLHALTGLTKIEALEILPLFEMELKQKGRLNFQDGGRPAKLDANGILLMLMMFYRHYDTLEALGALFDLNDSNVKRWIDSSEQALKNVLEKKSLSHLIAPIRKSQSRKPLSNNERSISMGLSSLCAGRKIM